jgi:hypothetical protein
MRKITIAAMVGIAALTSPAPLLAAPPAPSALGSDIRCFLLSNAYAKSATDPKARSAAAATLTFYLGRLDGRATPQVIASTMRSTGTTIDPKTAGAQMSGCAQQMARSEQSIQAAVRLLAAKK